MFKNLVNINSKDFSRVRYNESNNYSHAKNMHASVLLTLNEISDAVCFYPIIFNLDKFGVTPYALFGMKKDQNLYINEDGTWKVPFIPAHIRRYPFVLGKTDDTTKAYLMVDKDAPQLDEKQGNLLYRKTKDGFAESKILKDIQTYLVNLNHSNRSMKEFLKPLFDEKVLVQKALKTKIDGKEHTLKGFGVVDFEKVKALSDETLANWARTGLLQIINLHLLSLKNLNKF